MRHSNELLRLKEYAKMNPHGLAAWFHDNRTPGGRLYLSMGVVKLDDVPNWDTKAMEEDKP